MTDLTKIFFNILNPKMLLKVRAFSSGNRGKEDAINVMTVERALVTAQIFIFTRGSTQERSLISVLSVVRVSATAQLFEFIRESTQERKLINAMSITRGSIRIHIFTITAEEKPCNSVHFVVTALIKAAL